MRIREGNREWLNVQDAAYTVSYAIQRRIQCAENLPGDSVGMGDDYNLISIRDNGTMIEENANSC